MPTTKPSWAHPPTVHRFTVDLTNRQYVCLCGAKFAYPLEAKGAAAHLKGESHAA